MTDLWGELNIDKNEKEFEDSHAIELLRDQARLLEKKTNGCVKATFSKINYKPSTHEILSQSLVSIAGGGTKEEIIDTELSGKKDLNEIYLFKKYKFEIFNDTYRFRVFILNYRPVFPLELEPDEGIKDELNLSTTERINSDDELCNLVSSLFSSKKLKMIISRMIANS